MNKYTLITFDFDGTICDTAPAIIKTLLQLFPDADADEVNSYLSAGTPLNSVISALHNKPLSTEELDALCRTYRHHYNLENYRLQKPFPGVAEILAHFKRLGSSCLIVSNKGEIALRQFVNEYGLQHQFDNIIGERKAVPGKPKPDIYHKVISEAYPNIHSKQILHIGDTVADLEFAQNIGADSVYLTHGFGDDEAAMEMSPTWYCKGFHELNQLLTSGGKHV